MARFAHDRRGLTSGKLIERMQITGIEDLDKKLKKLTAPQFRTVVAKASNRAMKPVEKAAEAGVPKEFGILKKSISRKQKRYRRANTTITVVGPKQGLKQIVSRKRVFGKRTIEFKEPRDPVYYAHIVEKGTRPHTLGKGTKLFLRAGGGKTPGEQRGRMHPGSKAQPFLKPALVAREAQTVQIFADEMKRFIDEATR